MSRKADLEFVKKINQKLVLETIRNEQPISRAELARKLKLSRSTVSSIVDKLIEQKFVFESGFGSSTKDGGKPAIQLGFNPRSGFGVGVDIGGTKIWIHITDLDGNVIYKEKMKTTRDLAKINMMIRQSLQQVSVSFDDVVAVGFGIPGITDNETGMVIEAPALQWSNFRFKEEMSKYLPLPFFINNDVNCAALGERWLGSAKNTDDLVFIAIGTGVGSAIVIDGNLVKGHRFMAGEIGYLLDKEDVREQRKNQFGDFGVFEKKISGSALALSGNKPEEIFAEYAKGNPAVLPVIEDFIMTLSVAIANITSLLNPEKVVIGGGVSQSMEHVINRIRSTVAELTPIETSIDLASLGEHSAALGAIVFAFEQVKEVKG